MPPKGVSQLSLGDVNAVAERQLFFRMRFYAIMRRFFLWDAFICDFFFFFFWSDAFICDFFFFFFAKSKNKEKNGLKIPDSRLGRISGPWKFNYVGVST